MNMSRAHEHAFVDDMFLCRQVTDARHEMPRSSAQELQICVLCTKPLQRPGIDVFYVPSCKHVFCQECKQESLFCVNPYFLDQSLRDEDDRKKNENQAKTVVGFRCMVCLDTYARHSYDVTQAPLAVPALQTAPKHVRHNHITTQNSANNHFNGAFQLQCTNHKTGHQAIERYCLTCRLPLCNKCDRSHDRKHSIEPIGSTTGEYARNLVAVQESLEQHIDEQSRHKQQLTHLRSEQEWRAKLNKQDVQRHMTTLIEMVKSAGERLLSELDATSRQQRVTYDNAMKLCDYSTRSARKLRSLCDSIQTPSLLLNYPAIERRSQALQLYRRASANNASQLRQSHVFTATFQNFSSNGRFSIGKLQADTLPLEESEPPPPASLTPPAPAKSTINGSPRHKINGIKRPARDVKTANGPTTHDVKTTNGPTTHDVKMTNGPTTLDDLKTDNDDESFLDIRLQSLPRDGVDTTSTDTIKPATATSPRDVMRIAEAAPQPPTILSSSPQLKWRHEFSSGFEQNSENPNLQGAHFLSDDRLLVAYDRGVYCFEPDGGNFTTFEHRIRTDVPLGMPTREILWPQCFTECDTDHVAFTDRQQMTVYIYSKDGRFRHMMQHELFRQQSRARTERQYEATAPFGIVTLRNGHLAVSDKLQQTVHILDPHTGNIVRNFRQDARGGGGAGGGDDAGALVKPTFLALDRSGRLLVADSGSRHVKLYSVDGKYLGRLNAWSDSMATRAQPAYEGLQAPAGIVVDPRNGDLIIADHSPAHGLLHLSRRGEYLETLRVRDGARAVANIPFGLSLGSQGQLAMTHKLDGSLSVVQLYE